MKSKLLTIFTIIGLIGIIAYKLVDTGRVSINKPNAGFTVRGVDVSHHNGRLDWKRLAENGISFAYIKATEGGDFTDPRFNENWQRAKAAGITVGAYHFFTFCRAGQEQLDHFIKQAPPETGILPPAVDFEYGGNCKARPDDKIIMQELRIFMAGVATHYGQPPILYVTNDTYKTYIKNSMPGAKIWIRDIFKTPKLAGAHQWVFWQYNARGRLEGTDGPIDLNVYYGDQAAFEELTK